MKDGQTDKQFIDGFEEHMHDVKEWRANEKRHVKRVAVDKKKQVEQLDLENLEGNLNNDIPKKSR